MHMFMKVFQKDFSLWENTVTLKSGDKLIQEYSLSPDGHKKTLAQLTYIYYQRRGLLYR